MKKSENNYKEWLRKGVPAVLIPGLIFASIYGIKNIDKLNDYYKNERIFPKSGMVREVEDGDTIRLVSGQVVRLIGINAPDRGKSGYEEAKNKLEEMTKSQKLWLEYDRYQDDKYGRILAWVWVRCESDKAATLPADYMHISGNESREYVTSKPEGCQDGMLINREMVESGMAEAVIYEKRGRLKYELTKIK